MIEYLQISNFKAFGATQRISFKQINVIFGANSAGKSSLVHAILYMRYFYKTGVFDARRVLPNLDLGGFENYINGHDINKCIDLSIKAIPFAGFDHLNQSEKSITASYRIGRSNGEYGLKSLTYEIFGVDFIELTDIDEQLDLMMLKKINFGSPLFKDFLNKMVRYIERTVSRKDIPNCYSIVQELISSELLNEPLISASTLMQDTFRRNSDLHSHKTIKQRSANSRAPWINPILDQGDTSNDIPPLLDFLIRNKRNIRRIVGGGLDQIYKILENDQITEYISNYKNDLKRSAYYGRSSTPDPLYEILYQNAYISEVLEAMHYIHNLIINSREFLVKCIEYAQAALANELTHIVHLGPLRWFPEETIESQPIEDVLDVSKGQTAWLKLFSDSKLRNESNSALHRIGINYSINLRSLYSNVMNGVEKRHVSPIRNELLLRDSRTGILIRHNDVGVGISQVVPVVVNAIGASAGEILIIEQPELHLHPRLQTELGDIFIESSKNGHISVLETHSEHLLLRLLRRIRETSENRCAKDNLRLTPDKLNILYVSLSNDGSSISQLPITETGEFKEFWPEGFLADRSEELY